VTPALEREFEIDKEGITPPLIALIAAIDRANRPEI